MKTKELRGEKGQAAVFITLLLMFAFIALAALAIDGGHLYVVRRDLQNMADAGCLAAATELSLGGDAAAAIQKAKEYVIMNGGDFFSAWPASRPNKGSGTGLTWGIEVTGAAVRVALQEEVETYFTMIFKRPSALVGARAHCNSQAGGGLLPIAVRRYEYNEETSQQLDLLANKDADPRNEEAPCHNSGDCFYPATSSTETRPTRYGEIPFHPLLGKYKPILGGTVTDTTTGNIDCDLPPPDPDYDGVCVLGVHTTTNSGTENYTGWVALDIRNIVPGPIQYLVPEAGAEQPGGQAAANKALASYYFCKRGYDWDPPDLGDQLAFLPGVSADFAPKEMLRCHWREGDPFWGVVYSGYVWDVPDLKMSVEPAEEWMSPITYDDIGTIQTVTYTVTLEKVGPAPWPADAYFELVPLFMEQGVPGDPDNPYKLISPVVTFDPPTEVILREGENSTQATMIVSATITDTNYLEEYVSALTVQAHEILIGLDRWASTNFGFGGIPAGGDFTLYAHGLRFTVPQGGVLSIGVTTRGYDFSAANADLIASQQEGPTSDAFSQTGGSKIKIADGEDTSQWVNLKVKADAMSGTYRIKLTASPQDGPTHSVYIDVEVYVPTGGPIDRFVIVEGFAPFEITYIDENDMVAFATGPVVPELPSASTTYGMIPSLLPW